MKSDILKQLVSSVETVQSDRHRLVILLGAFGAGKTDLLKEAAIRLNGKYLNLNLELTERLLAVPVTQYCDGVTVHALIDDICSTISPHHEPLMVDNLEILFSPDLGKINPIDTFRRISRERAIVIALPAIRQGQMAIYSKFDHADYLAMPLEENTVIELPEE